MHTVPVFKHLWGRRYKAATEVVWKLTRARAGKRWT